MTLNFAVSDNDADELKSIENQGVDLFFAMYRHYREVFGEGLQPTIEVLSIDHPDMDSLGKIGFCATITVRSHLLYAMLFAREESVATLKEQARAQFGPGVCPTGQAYGPSPAGAGMHLISTVPFYRYSLSSPKIPADPVFLVKMDGTMAMVMALNAILDCVDTELDDISSVKISLLWFAVADQHQEVLIDPDAKVMLSAEITGLQDGKVVTTRNYHRVEVDAPEMPLFVAAVHQFADNLRSPTKNITLDYVNGRAKNGQEFFEAIKEMFAEEIEKIGAVLGQSENVLSHLLSGMFASSEQDDDGGATDFLRNSKPTLH